MKINKGEILELSGYSKEVFKEWGSASINLLQVIFTWICLVAVFVVMNGIELICVAVKFILHIFKIVKNLVVKYAPICWNYIMKFAKLAWSKICNFFTFVGNKIFWCRIALSDKYVQLCNWLTEASNFRQEVINMPEESFALAKYEKMLPMVVND